MFKSVARAFFPQPLKAQLHRFQATRRRIRISGLPPISENRFCEILTDRLDIHSGDTVMVHSSMDHLNLDFPFFKVLPLLLDVAGRDGTLVFPTFSKESSHDFLARGLVFDVRNTPSHTGALTELARRHRHSVRSLHPTKSVCAIGPLAEELTCEHHLAPLAYHARSPFYKLMHHGGKIVGLGASTRNLSFVHCVDDVMGDDFPVQPYEDTLYEANCIDRHGEIVRVEAYGHAMAKMKHDVTSLVKRHLPNEVCEDVTIDGMPFFRADAAPLFDHLIALARQGVTIYPRKVYKPRRRVTASTC